PSRQAATNTLKSFARGSFAASCSTGVPGQSPCGVLRQFPIIGPYVGTRTPVRIVSGGDLRTAITTGRGGMEERSGTVLTHVRDAERIRVLRLVTAVRKTRLATAPVRARFAWHGGPEKFARENSRRGRHQSRTGR